MNVAPLPAGAAACAGLDYATIATPAFVVDMAALARNAAVLAGVRRATGAKVLLALKGFAMFRAFPLLRPHLDGVCASGPQEAQLGAEEFGGEVHTYAPAFSDAAFAAALKYSTHFSFNSVAQWRRFRGAAESRGIPCGLRINPEFSAAPAALYDPCAPGSRLGVRLADLAGEDLTGLTGLHFHTLCQQDSDALEKTSAVVSANFGHLLRGLRWINCGGGHHLTRPGYDLARLHRVIARWQNDFGLEVYLEPGEAVGLGAGVLVSTVLDVVRNGVDIAILDTSATTHMPDVLEMPYRPEVLGAGRPGERPHLYRLTGNTCLAGDVVGDYSFDAPLRAGDRVVFLDMAHYTMVKTSTFNGMPLPAIAMYFPAEGRLEVVRRFGYTDYRMRLS